MAISSLHFSPLGRKGLRPLDVIRLRALIAPAKQEDQQLSALDIIDPVAGAKIDLHLDNAGTDAFRFPGVSIFRPIDPGQNFRAALRVSQAT
jgi:hypothetical protein